MRIKDIFLQTHMVGALRKRIIETSCLLTSLFTLITLPALAGSAERLSYPDIPQTGNTMEAFVPQGWMVDEDATGDLNGDGRPDIALIVEGPEKRLENRNCGIERKKVTGLYRANREYVDGMIQIDGVEMNESFPRILLVLMARKTGGYQLALRNNTIILRQNEGGMFDPVTLDSLDIRRNSLFLGYYAGTAWRWGISAQFRLRDGKWRLIGFSRSHDHTMSRAESFYDYNLLTGRLNIFTKDESGKRPGCVSCLRGRPCVQDLQCGEHMYRPAKFSTWIKGLKREPVFLPAFRCTWSRTGIIPVQLDE